MEKKVRLLLNSILKGKTTEENVLELIMMNELTITYDNGVQEQMKNPYVFELPSSAE